MNTNAVKDLIYRMADDSLIYAYRNAEWTGLAPTLEEDIAFSSIAQDKFGHAQALYLLLENLGESDPDTVAFTRDANAFHCCQFVEFETMEYSLALVRHFLFDTAERLRYELLEHSSYEPLAKFAQKVRGEIRYHTFHADTWMQLLGAKGSDESALRMQKAVEYCLPLAYSMFELTKSEDAIIAEGIFVGELALRQKWEEHIHTILSAAGLRRPALDENDVPFGGRRGQHTPALQDMIREMTEVYRIDPSAQW